MKKEKKHAGRETKTPSKGVVWVKGEGVVKKLQ